MNYNEENTKDKKGGVRLVALAAAFVLVMAGAVFAYNKLAPKYPEGPGAAPSSSDSGGQSSQDASSSSFNKEDFPLAPDFSVEDVDGNTVKLSDYRGTPVVLNFWASWCGPCKVEMPHFQTLKDEYEGQVVFLMVNLTDGLRETKESALAFIDEEGYNFNLVFDTKSEAAYSYRISSIPTTYFIDADGYALSREIGSLSEQTLRGRVESLLTAE